MGCLLALAAWISPRFVLACIWLFTSRLATAFSSGWEGVLGFLFLPYASVFYALLYSSGHGVRGFGWVIVGLGVLFDLASTNYGRHASVLSKKRARRVQA